MLNLSFFRTHKRKMLLISALLLCGAMAQAIFVIAAQTQQPPSQPSATAVAASSRQITVSWSGGHGCTVLQYLCLLQQRVR